MTHESPVVNQVGRLLNPRSVAVIGASEDQGKFGGRAFRMLLRHRFAGQVYPVNPNRAELFGLKTYPSVMATPQPADVALLAIPRAYLRRGIQECAAAGVGAAIIITSQFAESGEDGARDERELVEIARAARMRLLGPNCLGLVSPANQVVLTSSPALDIEELRAGSIGLVSQSGALMATNFDRANDLGIAFSHCVSVGNQADLELCDIVEYLVADDATRVICSYVEGFKDAQRALQLARRARAAGKPWLMVKAGRTQAGERAALSHTASLAGSYAALEAAARESGITLMDDPDAMVLAAAQYARFGPLAAPRVAIVTTSGGCGAIAADRLTDRGNRLAELSTATANTLARVFMPGQAANPIDLGGRREGEAVDVASVTLDAVGGDPQVDLTLIVLSTAPMLSRIAGDLVAPAARSGKPHLFVIWPGSAAAASRDVLLKTGAPFCDRLDDALRALDGWTACSSHVPVDEEPRSISAPAASPLTGIGDGPLGEAEAKELLAAYGIPVNEGRLVTSPDEAVAAARRIGFPVVLKAAVPGLIHKSDVGGVALDLATDADVRAAWHDIAARIAQPAAHGPHPVSMLVQRMVAGGVELIVGVKRDAQFGPVVLVGAGGVLVELLHDVQLALAPVGPAAALDLLRRLRAWPLLQDVRGRPPLDTAAVADVVSRVSWLAHDERDRLRELDINPLIVLEHGAVAVDARAVVQAR